MSETPYKRWKLTPSFKPVEVEIVEVEIVETWDPWGSKVPWAKTATGGSIAVSELHATKQAAIDYGRERLADQETKLLKMQQAIEKKRAALDKAEGAK